MSTPAVHSRNDTHYRSDKRSNGFRNRFSEHGNSRRYRFATKPADIRQAMLTRWCRSSGEIWPEVFKCTNFAALSGVRRLAAALAERELRSYRAGVYMQTGHHPHQEPSTASYLPPHSVIRGLADFLRKQVSPSERAAVAARFNFRFSLVLNWIYSLREDDERDLKFV